jgi:hypothetical protein
MMATDSQLPSLWSDPTENTFSNSSCSIAFVAVAAEASCHVLFTFRYHATDDIFWFSGVMSQFVASYDLWNHIQGSSHSVFKLPSYHTPAGTKTANRIVRRMLYGNFRMRSRFPTHPVCVLDDKQNTSGDVLNCPLCVCISQHYVPVCKRHDVGHSTSFTETGTSVT